jgi:3-polyprenyl-4-hydroxybenzoate decarboxylase
MPYPYSSLGEWLAEEEELGYVRRFKEPIKCGDYNNIVEIGNGVPGMQPETEIRALVRYLHTLPGKPIGIIEKPVNNRPDVPVIVNPWPNRARVLRGMGIADKDTFCNALADIKERRIPPVVVDQASAPCKDVIIRGDDIDIHKHLPLCWVEFNQVPWSTCNATVILYDEETGTHNLGKLRVGQYEWENANPEKPFPPEKVKREMFATLMYAGNMTSNSGRYYRDKYKKNRRSMPAALITNHPTDIHIVGAIREFRWPGDGDEYDFVGGFRGEPVAVVPSETIPGLMVPAHAEWVIEGEFLPEDERMPEYAEDIASGYLFGGELCPIFRVNCITHKNKPSWDATTFSSSGSSTVMGESAVGSHEGPHTGLQFMNCEPVAINFLRSLGFLVKDIVMVGGGREVAVIQLAVDGEDKPMPYYGKQVLMALHGNPGFSIGPPTKYLIVVGPDINPYDFNDVMWALGTRSWPIADSVTVENGVCGWGDPSGIPGYTGFKTYGEQIMIDGTIKVPERFESFPPRAEPLAWEEDAIAKMRARFG